MKKLKLLLVAAICTVSGAAMAEMIMPFDNPASVYNPATGHYEAGCGAFTFAGTSGNQQFGPMLNGASTYTLSSVYIYCSSGTLYASGDAYQGYFY